MLPMVTGPPETDALTGQGTRHECRLALSDDTLTIVCESCNGSDFVDLADNPPASQAASQVARNSAKCGSLSEPARSSTFTRSTSSA